MVDEAEEGDNLDWEVDVDVDIAVVDLVTEIDAATARHNVQISLSKERDGQRACKDEEEKW